MSADLEIKHKLLDICKKELNVQILGLIEAMDIAQGEANEHIGAMESRYDSFKEEAQQRVSGFARQIHEKKGLIPKLAAIDPKKEHKLVSHGSLIRTDGRNYFFSAYIFTDPVEIDGELFFPVGIDSPIGYLFEGKAPKDTVSFNGTDIQILSVS